MLDREEEGMTGKKAIEILQSELSHTECHLKDSGKAPEFYEELGNLCMALERGIESIRFMEEHQAQTRGRTNMICPYRKKTEAVDSTTSEYYMECYGTECPFYVPENNTHSNISVPAYCNRADTDFYIATHGEQMK